jgi:lipoprotein-releasing system permease protein
MAYELAAAKRIFFQSGKRLSAVVRMAVFSVGLGITVMFLSVVIVSGFRKQITNKMTGFSGHVLLSHFSSNQSYESAPIDASKVSIKTISKVKHVKSIQPYATKACILKTKSQMQGVVLKGVTQQYHWQYLAQQIVRGHIPKYNNDQISNEIIISQATAQALQLDTGAFLFSFFIEGTIQRIKKCKVAAIYDTGFEEVDKTFVICDLNLVRQLNNWQQTEVGGFEILLDDYNNLAKASKEIYAVSGADFNTKTINEVYPQIISWLGLIDTNVYIILGLMCMVACINMVSALLIIILDQTQTIGLYKAMGATNPGIRKIFLLVALYLLAFGLLIGNLLGILLAGCQYYFQWFALDKSTYYLEAVPIYFSWSQLLLLNLSTIFICIIALIVPTMVVSRLMPVKSIKFT